MKHPLTLIGLMSCALNANAGDCQLDIHHSSVDDQHHFRLEVSCQGTYNTLTYLLRASRIRNNTTMINSESGKLLIQGDSKETGDVVLDLREGDQVLVEARILQACEVLEATTLEYQHTADQP